MSEEKCEHGLELMFDACFQCRIAGLEAEVARLRDFLLDCMGYRTCAWCHVKVDRTVEHKGDWISEPNAHAKGCELVAVLATTSDPKSTWTP